MSDYESKAKTVSIKATSRASVKIKDSYYTVEFCEERVIPDVDGVSLNIEKELLWEAVNMETDNQVEEILQTFKN